MGVSIVFHNTMMLDPSNIDEFAGRVGRAPKQAELSHFLYWDALGGGMAMLENCLLRGLTVGMIGSILGRIVLRADRKRTAA